MARGLGLCGLDTLEELLEDPQQRLVVSGTEDFGDETTTTGQKITGQTQGHQS